MRTDRRAARGARHFVPTAARRRRRWLLGLFLSLLLFAAVFALLRLVERPGVALPLTAGDGTEIPAWAGEDCVELNGGVPLFTPGQLTRECYVSFSPLDRLGRTGAAIACLGPETLPRMPRGRIDASIRPSGWHSVRYDALIEDGYLYNRCHVIGYLLCGDEETRENLFTGTRHLNRELMLPYEKEVADEIAETGHHVLYRCTPLYRGRELLARGVELEAYSVEDEGRGVCFHVVLYNVQPGIAIDYATGTSAPEK